MFWKDHSTLAFTLFFVKINALEGKFQDMIKARQILTGKIKSDSKEEKKWAKNYMTPEIKVYQEESTKKGKLKVVETMVSGLERQLENNKRRKEAING